MMEYVSYMVKAISIGILAVGITIGVLWGSPIDTISPVTRGEIGIIFILCWLVSEKLIREIINKNG